MSGLILVLSFTIEIHVFNANSVDPDQTPRSAASDLVLHCLLMFLFWDARHKWVKIFKQNSKVVNGDTRNRGKTYQP